MSDEAEQSRLRSVADVKSEDVLVWLQERRMDVAQLAGGSTGPLSDTFAAGADMLIASQELGSLLLLIPLMPQNSAAAGQRRRRLADPGSCDQESQISSGTRTVTVVPSVPGPVVRLYSSPDQCCGLSL